MTYPRAISAGGLQELFAQESGHAWITFIVVNHASMGTPLRICNDMKDQTFGGDLYIGVPFEIALAVDDEDTVPTVSLRLDNVGRDLVDTLRSITDRADVSVTHVRIDGAGAMTSEIGPLDFKLIGSEITMCIVDISLGLSTDPLNAPATKEIFTSTLAPGLF